MAKQNESKAKSSDDKAKESVSEKSDNIAVAHAGSNTGSALAEEISHTDPKHGTTVKELAVDKEIHAEEKRQELRELAELPLKDQQAKVDRKNVIKSEKEAFDLIKREYQPLKDVKGAHVTSDGNVFWPENGGSAHNHAVQNNLKVFSVSWD